MAIMSSQLFAKLSQEASFLSEWGRVLQNLDGNGERQYQPVDLRRDFHRPDSNLEDPVVNMNDIVNFKESLFAFVMLLARAKSQLMESKGQNPKNGVKVRFEIAFNDTSVHPETKFSKPFKDLDEMNYDKNSVDDKGRVFYKAKNPSGPDTFFISVLPDFDLENVKEDDMHTATVLSSDEFVQNAIALFQSGLVAMSCYDN